jgi:hypothetical protein
MLNVYVGTHFLQKKKTQTTKQTNKLRGISPQAN